jgi:hypothetical protein
VLLRTLWKEPQCPVDGGSTSKVCLTAQTANTLSLDYAVSLAVDVTSIVIGVTRMWSDIARPENVQVEPRAFLVDRELRASRLRLRSFVLVFAEFLKAVSLVCSAWDKLMGDDDRRNHFAH